MTLDIETGEYDFDERALIRRVHRRNPDRAGTRYGLRIGYRASHVMGGALGSLKR